MATKQLRSEMGRAFARISAGCVLGVIVLYLALSAYQRLEWRVSDNLAIKGRRGVLPANVVFLAIDDPSITLDALWPEELEASPALGLMKGGWPWDRRIYPQVISRLVDAGASVVAFDVLFKTPNDRDADLADALAKYREHVVFGSNLELVETTSGARPTLVRPPTSLIPTTNGDDSRLGYVNVQPDAEDGKVRRVTHRTTLMTFFGEVHSDTGDPELFSLTAQSARKGGFESHLPPDSRPRMFRFVTDLPKYSVYQIFVPALWKAQFRNGEFFKDKIVFVGPFGNWSKDEQLTPLGLKAGPQIHLSALSSIINRDFLRESPVWLDLLLVAAAGVVAWFFGVSISHPIRRFGVLLLVVILYVGAAFLLFNYAGYCLQLLSPNLALLSAGLLGLVWERVVETRERTRTRATLERYVSRDVVKEVLDNPESYLNTLAGVSRKPITLLFSDVRGFTTLTESGDAEKLVQQLNEYFTEMVRIVFSYHGTLDKFMGDAVMASWGALGSEGTAADAGHAVSAALDMLRSLKTLNVDWRARGMLELKIGLGVNHGEAICGNLGSEEKREFTAIGDAVNLASRLEGATKEFHVDLLIGELTAPLVRDRHTVRSVDLLKVKGKTRPVEVFTVLDCRDGTPVPAWLAPYEEGIRLYRQRAFAEAEQAFTQAAAGQPEDWLIGEYQRRTRAYLAEPPPPEWDGVFVMTTK